MSRSHKALDRRQILRGASAMTLGSALGVGMTSGPAQAFGGGCMLTPAQIAGPFYRDLNLVRRDITEGQPGLPMLLRFRVLDVDGCTPLVGAEVDVWHNNAEGRYSNFSAKGTAGETWLRGAQFTDANGIVQFRTVYPGWYQGRTTHIHLKVFPQENYELNTQLYFNDRMTNDVYLFPPYAANGPKDTTNQQDAFQRPKLRLGTIARYDVTGRPRGVVARKTLVADQP